MAVISKILFPTDGSETSGKALEFVKSLGSKLGAHVTLLHIYEFPLLVGGFDVSPNYVVELEENLEKNGNEILEQAKTELTAAGVSTETVLVQGNPGQAIVDYVNKHDFDLLVIGSHGRSTLRSILIGSTSNFVIHHTSCPTLIIQKEDK